MFENKDDKCVKEYIQSDLWKFSISGDLPIIVAKIKSVKDILCVKELVDAMEFFVLKRIKVDLVIITDELKNEAYIENKIREYVYSKNIGYLLNVDGGIHLLNENLMLKAEKELFDICASIYLDASDGSLGEQLEGGAKI
jgi:cellobiose phosphorylase